MATEGIPYYYLALSEALANQFPGYEPIEGQGSFNYNWQGLTNTTLFNANTFTQLNSILQPGNNSATQAPTLMLAPSQTLSGGWSTLINQMVYQLSQTDNTTLINANQAAQAQQAAVIAAYQQSIGAITPAMITAAQTAMGIAAPIPFTAFNYVVDFTMCWVWSGYTQEIIAKPLTYMQIQQGMSDPTATFPAMPAGGASVLAPMIQYLSAVSPILGLQAQLATGSANLIDLKRNTARPTLTNPQTGMSTINSNGLESPTPVNAWSVQTSPQSIVNGLGGIPPQMPAAASLQLVMQASQQSASSYSVSINGDTGFTVGDGWLMFEAQGSGDYDMTSSAWAGTSYAITVAFNYPTVVSSIQPLTYDPNTDNGWFWALALQLARTNYQVDLASPNTAPNNTGYNFLNAPVFDLFLGGNFGYINNLLISQYPTISINYSNGDYNSFVSEVGQDAQGSLTLFGLITLASAGGSTQSMTATQNSNGQGFTVQIAPPPPSVSTGYYDQTACLVAALPAYPGSSA